MKILLLTSFDLFPPVHGGSSIAYNFVKHAAARHDVSVLISHLYSLGGEVDLLRDNVHVHYCPPSFFDHFKVMSFLFNPHYYHAADYVCHSSQPDVIQCETLWPIIVGWRLRRKYGVPLVCVEYNVEADKFANLGRPKVLIKLVHAIERFACQQADHIVVLTELDRCRLMQLYNVPSERVTVIKPSPDLSDFRFNEEERAYIRSRYHLSNGDTLLTFVGNLQYEPNEQAVRRIVDFIYPAVIDRYPNSKFLIIGRGAERLTSCQRDQIIFTGYLSRKDLVAHLCATDIFLVPVEIGSGMRIKIPEATACALAVVATQKAAEGLEFFQDSEILRVKAVDEHFVSAVLRLIEDQAWRKAIGMRARARTIREFGWEKTIAAYEKVYAKLEANPRSGSYTKASELG